MNNISIHNLSFQYEEALDPTLDSLTAAFAEGWTGIVGENGAGKSTLMKILSGELKGYTGHVDGELNAMYCPQSTDVPPYNMEDFALDYSNDVMRLKDSLRIEDDWMWRFGTLSHGERKRIQIGAALYLAPNILALDEPTNHLDVTSKEILLAALREYTGIGLLVSHDRDFLDSLVYQCLFLRKGKGTLIGGTYSQAKQELEIRGITAQRERQNARQELSRVKAESQRRSVEASRTASRLSARNLDKKDSDGRAKRGLAIYSGQDGKTGLLASQMDKKVERAQDRVKNATVEKTYDGQLEIDTKVLKRKSIIQKEAGEIALGESRTLSFPAIFVGGTDKIGLWGPNGSGKSTFLNMLLREERDFYTLYIPQELTTEQGREILKNVKQLSQSDLGSLLSIVAQLNSSPDRILSGDDLSPGELRKIMLAEGLIRQPSLVVMDEPTNHLDIHSIEALQNVLSSCECALMIVSHDRQFLDALADTKWEFSFEDDAHSKLTVVL